MLHSVLIVGLALYCGWLHRRVKYTEAKLGLVTPHLVTQERLEEIVSDVVDRAQRIIPRR